MCLVSCVCARQIIALRLADSPSKKKSCILLSDYFKAFLLSAESFTSNLLATINALSSRLLGMFFQVLKSLYAFPTLVPMTLLKKCSIYLMIPEFFLNCYSTERYCLKRENCTALAKLVIAKL